MADQPVFTARAVKVKRKSVLLNDSRTPTVSETGLVDYRSKNRYRGSVTILVSDIGATAPIGDARYSYVPRTGGSPHSLDELARVS